MEIITVVPAKTTARPAESMAATVASRGRATLVEAFPVAGDDEEGVVDPDAEPDHHPEQDRCRRGW